MRKFLSKSILHTVIFRFATMSASHVSCPFNNKISSILAKSDTIKRKDFENPTENLYLKRSFHNPASDVPEYPQKDNRR